MTCSLPAQSFHLHLRIAFFIMKNRKFLFFSLVCNKLQFLFCSVCCFRCGTIFFLHLKHTRAFEFFSALNAMFLFDKFLLFLLFHRVLGNLIFHFLLTVFSIYNQRIYICDVFPHFLFFFFEELKPKGAEKSFHKCCLLFLILFVKLYFCISF